MFDEKKIKEVKENVSEFLRNGIIYKGEKEHVDFFITNAENSLDTAKLLFRVSTDENMRKYLKLPEFNGFLWVINSSYYSMFYIARALLENQGIKIKTTISIHAITLDAFIYYFYLTGKLDKSTVEDFVEAMDETSEILGKENAKRLVEDYMFEKTKRGKFTYEIGAVAFENKANTSLDRAKRFNEEVRKILELGR